MSFSDMLAADMAVLVNTSEFAQAATYLDPGGQSTSLNVVLMEEVTETPEANGVKTKLRIRNCTWPAEQQQAVNLRAKVRIGEEDWSVAQLVYADQYQVTVRLERHELHEHTRPEYRRK